jgi:ATP-dependent exoDNAse (exonuclease V) alpha subunit
LAIFRLQIRPVSRAKGENAVEAAAYISRERLRDEQGQRTYNYRRRGGLVHAEILVPLREQATAPPALPQRAELWNQAERAERKRNARVAREYQFSLPHELEPTDRIALARRFAQEIANRHGGAVDLAVHNAPAGGDPRNVHAHVLSTTREYHPEGLGKKTTMEINDQSRRALGLPSARVEYRQIRARWAEFANEAMRERGIDARIDHRSLIEQGITRPAHHVSRAAYAFLRQRGRTHSEQLIGAEQTAADQPERANTQNQPAQSLEVRRQLAVATWQSYREQARDKQQELGRGRDTPDKEWEPRRSADRDFER